jgi:hypothetical protein
VFAFVVALTISGVDRRGCLWALLALRTACVRSALEDRLGLASAQWRDDEAPLGAKISALTYRPLQSGCQAHAALCL